MNEQRRRGRWALALGALGVIALIACAGTRGPMIGDTDVHAMLIERVHESGESAVRIKLECMRCHKASSVDVPRIPMRDLSKDRRNCLKCHK